jgi:hypothetical protein
MLNLLFFRGFSGWKRLLLHGLGLFIQFADILEPVSDGGGDEVGGHLWLVM